MDETRGQEVLIAAAETFERGWEENRPRWWIQRKMAAAIRRIAPEISPWRAWDMVLAIYWDLVRLKQEELAPLIHGKQS